MCNCVLFFDVVSLLLFRFQYPMAKKSRRNGYTKNGTDQVFKGNVCVFCVCLCAGIDVKIAFSLETSL